MSVPGYDQRTRKTSRVPYVSFASNGYNEYAGHSWEKTQSTISYRDSIEGKRVDPLVADPYGVFLARSNPLEEYLNPDDRLLINLESAGLAEPADYESKGFVDTGHPFSTVSSKVGTSLRQTRSYTSRPQGTTVRGGPIFAHGCSVRSGEQLFPMNDLVPNSFSLATPIPMPTVDQLVSDAKVLYTRAAPGYPKVDVSQFLAELFGDFPRIPGKALLAMRDYQSGGDEWLNLAFGVIPTVGDGLEIASVLKDVSQQYLKLRKEAGKYTRRGRSLPLSSRTKTWSTTDLNTQGSIQGGPGYGFNRFPVVGGSSTSNAYELRAGPTSGVAPITEFSMSETREVYFKGSFTYYLPVPSGLFGRLGKYVEEYDRVLGLSLDPASVWALTPWSWLIDWFFDVREMITLATMSRDDNLVMNYGYGMETITRTCVQKSKFAAGFSNGGLTYCSSYSQSVSKRRIRANPYGFVSSGETGLLDPYRLAILSALGISRL